MAADPMLQNLGRNAFKSLVGSYACFSSEMRQFFCYKDLHLGHVAKSLACSETPREIARSCLRNVESEMSIDDRKKTEARAGKRFAGVRNRDDGVDRVSFRRISAEKVVKENNKAGKKPRLDQAHRNMMAEFGL